MAALALFVALGGTAIAASHYLITSASQIKPSVLRQIRAEAEASAAMVAKKGAKSVVARARSVGTTLAGTESSRAEVALTGNCWTQQSDELDQITGQAAITAPHNACDTPETLPVANVKVYVAGQLVADAFDRTGENGVQKMVAVELVGGDSVWQVFEPGTTTPRTLTVQAGDNCQGEHFTINSVSIDVIGVR